MHEMGIMQGILDASVEAAQNAGESRITYIHLTIGELTQIQVGALDFAFEALSPATMAKGAKMDVTMLEPKSRCRDCGYEYVHDQFTMTCPKCSSFDIELLQGRELQIDTIEADSETESTSAESDRETEGSIEERGLPHDQD